MSEENKGEEVQASLVTGPGVPGTSGCRYRHYGPQQSASAAAAITVDQMLAISRDIKKKKKEWLVTGLGVASMTGEQLDAAGATMARNMIPALPPLTPMNNCRPSALKV